VADGNIPLPHFLLRSGRNNHAVEVNAESPYEAVALAVAEFRQGEILTETPGAMTEFCVTVLRKPIERRIRSN
jgi:hypothetical protein